MMIAHNPRLHKTQGSFSRATLCESSASQATADAARLVRRMMSRKAPGQGQYVGPSKADLQVLLDQLHLVLGLVMDLEDATGLPDAPATVLAIMAAYGRNTPIELDVAA